MTINALACADSVIIPCQTAYLPVKGLQQLIKTIGRVKRQLNPKLEIEGIGNVRRGLEDQIEQNDNSLDGIINNVKAQEPSERICDNNSNGIPDEEEL